MYQPTLAGTGTPETRRDSRPRPSRPLPFTLRIAESPAPVAGAPAMHSSAEAADFIRPQIGAADREAFVILHLDVKNQLLDVELAGFGDVDSSAVYARQVFKSALLRNASSLIFCHNHPSGDPEPSLCDRQLTRDLVVGAHALGIKVLDHIIVGRGPAFFSFADKGLLDDFAIAATLGQIREDAVTYVPQVGQAVRVRPSSDIRELVGLPGVVVAFVAGPTDGSAWPLVAFDEPHVFPSGVQTHSGHGHESEPVPAKHRNKCWYFSPDDLEVL